jgi:hypothetical protein
MKERPILFSGAMVRALLDGTKTQTRRAVANVDPDGTVWKSRSRMYGVRPHTSAPPDILEWCPYGQPGDQLWVREAFMHEPADYCWEASVSVPCRPAVTTYRADFPNSQPGEGWKPSIHMPRALSRITLGITSVRVERLQDISEADALAEGIVRQADGGYGLADTTHYHFTDPRQSYLSLWESINGAGSVEENPWVWAVELRRLP